MIRADRFVAPPAELTEYVFNFYDWDVRPAQPAALSARVSLRMRRAGGDRLLSHADTDLLTLAACARRSCRPICDIVGISLLRLQTEEQLALLLEGDLGARAGRRSSAARRARGRCPDSSRSRRMAASSERASRRGQRHGRAAPGLRARRAPSPLDVVDAVRLYLMLGGERNVGECAEVPRRIACCSPATAARRRSPCPNTASIFAMSRTRRSTTGSSAPIRRSRRRRSCSIARICCSGNLAFVDALVDALEDAGLNALAVFTSSLRALDGRSCRSRCSLIGGRADVLISTLSFALGEVNAGGLRVPSARACVRATGRADRPGDHQRHAARSLGGVAARADGARHGDQRRHSRVRRPDHLGADLVQGSFAERRRPASTRRMPDRIDARRRHRRARWPACASCRGRTCASRSC